MTPYIFMKINKNLFYINNSDTISRENAGSGEPRRERGHLLFWNPAARKKDFSKSYFAISGVPGTWQMTT